MDVDVETPQSDHRRGTAIDQEIGLAARDMKTGVEAPARAKGIAAADELQMHSQQPPAFGWATPAGNSSSFDVLSM
jgi:hypothetical protein